MNPIDFVQAIENSDLGQFQFSQDFIFDLWGSINDARNGRLKN
jgi:PDZ domain-containing protein GIPC